MDKVITIHKMDNDWNEEYFFSTSHCQPDLTDDWVPVTRYNTTKEAIKDISNGRSSREIPNPNPLIKPKLLL